MEEPRQHRDRFDAFALVARHGHIVGNVDPFDLDRVQDSLGDEDGEIPPSNVAYRLEGGTDALGRAVLEVALAGEVPLQCQRCMRLFSWPVQQRTEVLLARDEQDLAYLDENDEREVILAAGPLDPLEVVEEELVLTLPYVPRCDRPDCVADVAADIAGDDEHGSAFGALGALKRDGKPGK